MITPKVTGTKVVFGPVRLSYVHLFERYNPDNAADGGKYCAVILIPESEKETITAIRKAIAEARSNGIVLKWHGKEPKKLDEPLHDGEDKAEKDDVFSGHLYINAKSNLRPGILDRNGVQIVDEDDVYSGMWAIVSVTFYPYDVSGNRGIACLLNNVMKFKDDERFGGKASTEADFAGISINEESDDDL